MNTISNSSRSRIDSECARFSGIACSWQTNTDNIRVRPEAVAYAIRIAETDKKQRGGVMLWPLLQEHFPDKVFGWVASAAIIEDGLEILGYIDPITPEARKMFQRAKNGEVNGLSIGFKVIAEHREGTVRVLDKIEIFEVSVGADPVDLRARLKSMKPFSDFEYATMRAIRAEQRELMSDDAKALADLRAKLLHDEEEEEEKMADRQWVDDEGYQRPLYSGTRTVSYDEPAQGYRIDPNNKDEDPANFERAWRAELREEDDIWLLTDKNRVIELEKRDQERRQKQAAQHEALLKDRKERAEARLDMTQDWSPEAFAAKLGLDPVWMRRLFAVYVERGVVEPVGKDTLMLHGSDVQRIARKEAEAFEFQAIKARNKRAQEVR